MSENWFELAIIVFIIAGIGAAIWKGGQANPEGTGSLGKRLSRLDSALSKLRGNVDTMNGKITAIEARVEDIDERAAKTSDMQELRALVVRQNEQLAALAAQTAGIAAAADQRGRQLDMIYQQIVQKGMNA